jgi:hypothetical protein
MGDLLLLLATATLDEELELCLSPSEAQFLLGDLNPPVVSDHADPPAAAADQVDLVGDMYRGSRALRRVCSGDDACGLISDLMSFVELM